MTYAELRRLGIEFPATVVFEVELAGVPLQRCFTGTGAGRRAVGVQLDSATSGTAPGWTDVRFYQTSSVRMPTNGYVRAPAILGLAVLALAAVLAVALPGGAAHHDSTRRPASAAVARHGRNGRTRSPAKRRLSFEVRGVAGSITTTSRTSTAPGPSNSGSAQSPVSPTLAAQLDVRGHELLLSGQYSSAVAVLERAVAATGESSSACLEPTTGTCLTYAFALYDLGRALQLSGQPAAAIPVLMRRLAIDNQRPVVASELALARRQAG